MMRDVLSEMINNYSNERGIKVEVSTASTYHNALTQIIKDKFDAYILDLKLSNETGSRTGFDLIKVLRMLQKDAKCTVCSSFPRESQGDISKYQLVDYLQKPVNQDNLYSALDKMILGEERP